MTTRDGAHSARAADWFEVDVKSRAGRRGIVLPKQLYELKASLADAGVRDARLHDARHTAATVLLLLEVPERAVMGFMGWSNSSMAKRYQHVAAAPVE